MTPGLPRTNAEFVGKLAAVYERDKHGHPPMAHVHKLFFVGELRGGEAEHSLETDGVEFFGEDELPPLSLTRVTATQLKHMFGHYRNPGWPPPTTNHAKWLLISFSREPAARRQLCVNVLYMVGDGSVRKQNDTFGKLLQALVAVVFLQNVVFPQQQVRVTGCKLNPGLLTSHSSHALAN